MIDNMVESRIYWLLAQAQHRALSKEEITELEELGKGIDDPKLASDIAGVWRLTEDYSTTWKPEVGRAWSTMKIRLETDNHQLRVRRLRRQLVVAASLLLLLGVTTWGLWKENSSDLQVFTTAEGEIRDIKLTDGSVVSLNENSRLIISSVTGRKVELQGEAFFQVSRFKGQRFEVTTDYGRISVLGTSFNVRASSSEQAVEVAVASGKVAVAGLDERKSIVLGPGNAVRAAADGSLQPLKMPAKNYYAWQKGNLYLKATTIVEAFDLLSRFYGIKITYSDTQLTGCAARITGNWQRNNLSAFKTYLLMSTGLELVSTDGKVFELRGQCR